MIGETILHFKIIEKVGEGGMGAVYKALDLKLGRTVALKFLLEKSVQGVDETRFLREARAAAILDHPNVCTVYDAGEIDGRQFIVMSYIDGPSLAARIKLGPLTVSEALSIAIQIGQGLHAAHQKGIIHRDIKSSNILLTAQGQVKITDFGIARLASDARITRSGSIVGTPAYMPPELILGQGVGRCTDIWALGVVLYEMIAGRRPFQGENEHAVLYSIVHSEPEPLSALKKDVPADLDRVVARLLAKDPAKRYQHVEDALAHLSALLQSRTKISELSTRSLTGARLIQGSHFQSWLRSVPLASILVVLSVAVAVSAIFLWMYSRRSPEESKSQFSLAALTSDNGLTFQPALSRDGNFLAYSSDRADGSNLDIWVKQVGGGEPIRLTTDPADDYQPAFSPDGTKIAFRSDREPRGIYVVSTLGGPQRLIAKDLYMPAFSPDGTLIACRDGSRELGNRIFLVALDSDQPKPVPIAFQSNAPRYWFQPIWAGDGAHLLFASGNATDIDHWWLAPARGGGAIDSGIGDVFRSQKFSVATPEAWLPGSNWVVFSAFVRGGANKSLWRVQIDPHSGRVEGAPQRLTFGTGSEAQVSASSGGRMAFASLSKNIHLWTLPVAADEGKVSGGLQPVTTGHGVEAYPSVAADGKHVVFVENGKGKISFVEPDNDIRMTELGTETAVDIASSPASERSPVIARDGSVVAYSVATALDSQTDAIYVAYPGGGPPQKLCDDCGLPHDWSADKQKLLVYYGYPTAIYLLDVDSRRRTRLVYDADSDIFAPAFSPDDRWIAFHARKGERRSIYVAPLRGESEISRQAWIPVTDGSGNDAMPAWAPNANALYFLSERDGFQCLWFQHLNAVTKRPEGPVRPVYHFHRARLSAMNAPSSGMVGPAVARDRIVLALGEISGNIWMMDPVKSK